MNNILDLYTQQKQASAIIAYVLILIFVHLFLGDTVFYFVSVIICVAQFGHVLNYVKAKKTDDINNGNPNGAVYPESGVQIFITKEEDSKGEVQGN